MSVIIEDENGWGVSFTSHNPEAEDFIQCASYEDANRLHERIECESKWQQIETAPKDCRIILGRIGHPWACSARWNERYMHWATGGGAMDFFADPTHWMLPPEAPTIHTSQQQTPEIFHGTLDALNKLGVRNVK